MSTASYSAQFSVAFRKTVLNFSGSSNTTTLLDNGPTKVYLYPPDGRLLLQSPRRLPSKPLRLPAELDDYIMEYLSYDPQALQAAALTCRAWLAAARPYLFRYLDVTTETQMQRVISAIRSSPMISSCIRTLRIGESAAEKRSRGSSCVTRFLASLTDGPNFPRNLCSLELIAVAENWDVKTVTKLARLTSVVNLSLIKCGVSSDELAALVSAFPNLRHANIEHCVSMFCGRMKRTALPCLHDVRLTSLKISSNQALMGNSDSLLDALLASGSRHTLSSVQFVVGEAEVQPVGEFLWAMGPRLVKLELGFWIEMGTLADLCSKVLKHIDLSHNSRLEELTVHDPTFPVIQLMLCQVSSPCLRRLSLRISPAMFACGGRATLAAVLSTAPFRRLESVCFLYDGPFLSTVEPEVKAAFQEMEERGIVRVSSTR